MDVFNSLLPSCSFSVLVFFSFLPFSTFDIHRYRPVFSVNLFLVFGFSFSLSLSFFPSAFLSLCFSVFSFSRCKALMESLLAPLC